MKRFSNTVFYNGLTTLLETSILVGDPEAKVHFSTKGLWDTGASNSMISEHVVEVLGLIPLGRALVSGFHGMAHLRTYGVSISLGKGLAFANMEVVAAKVITDEHHVLLGMDIISQLDFAITNASEQTIHSIQYPSSAKIDFQQMGID